jgi:uncharacterized protein YecT (DUF1311 family)
LPGNSSSLQEPTMHPFAAVSRPLPAIALLCLLVPAALPALADPTLECSATSSSQVETGNCLSAIETTVDGTVETAFGFAMASAKDLDDITGRAVAVPALTAAQAAWSAYRDAECEAIGAGFGGGSGTGIAITACRIDLGRARVDQLMRQVN